ncbi:DnaJ domain-containing protein [Williamsoniiplasma lucivorax]|uniref:J domain-containing protein n=1 Tax=Williamsoniiplasma lucivorax TaxID=209274 RepID=A0A2S5REN6_9MOLU|nr:DnaJ domain-containing protein [Williamsoniiplasma lucivorax]PPE05789.1 hypothetical protein ELUCI_v1c00770 [Williamsoniiplasma lucivorax]
MKTIFIILIIFIIISIFSGGGFWAKRSSGNRKNKQENTFDVFAKNKKIWLQQQRKTHQIRFYNIEELFDVFPFFSNYNETKTWLIKNNVSSGKVNAIIQSLLTHEDHLMKFWAEQEKKLLIAFDQTHLPQSQQAINFLLQYYNLFLDAFKHEMVNIYIKDIIPAIIGEVLNDDPQKIIQDHRFINFNEFIRFKEQEFYADLEHDVDLIIQELFNQFSSNNSFYSSFEQQQNQQYYNFNEEVSELGKAYKTLGVDENISDQELKSTYRKLAMEYHPDKNKSHGAKEKMAKVNAAYDLIKKVRNIK